ncbi:YeiH family protein [Paenibacillus sonchi]|uniref:YeiH family protein n=1 Tax=Paenibacillus sonchi TaxID=373687 RepID=UPI001E2DDF50|nr:putative sulfate exporter family transporter [Paenibacillus sonchi]MCE3200899.1 putative sulfate exporter family transporter [Paenibacillus sonchi]
MNHTHKLYRITYRHLGFIQGIGITFLLAVAAKYLALLPFLNILGQLVLAILLGIALRGVAGVPQKVMTGIQFSSKKLLRTGIILLGMRLNLADILAAGPKVFAIAVINIAITLFTVYGIAKRFGVDRRLGLLTACGTAICGAAAVAAIAPQIKASEHETAVGAATVAVLGTIFTLAYSLLYPFLGLSPSGYGIFAGGTLHEVAHVIAAAAPAGKEAADLAVIVKLTRVAMLIPVAIIIGCWETYRKRKQASEEGTSQEQQNQEKGQPIEWKRLPVPWFILGFLFMSGVNTIGIVPVKLAGGLIALAYLLLAMAMAGMGLGVDLKTFGRMGKKPFLAGLMGSVLLSGLGYVLVLAFGLA